MIIEGQFAIGFALIIPFKELSVGYRLRIREGELEISCRDIEDYKTLCSKLETVILSMKDVIEKGKLK